MAADAVFYPRLDLTYIGAELRKIAVRSSLPSGERPHLFSIDAIRGDNAYAPPLQRAAMHHRSYGRSGPKERVTSTRRNDHSAPGDSAA
jgi:hypothetical protein